MKDIKANLDNWKGKVKGKVVVPGDSDYDEVRKIWNATIDRRPAVILRCAGAEDVQNGIAFARENGLELTVRGAGHNIAGNAIADNGFMIDLSLLKNVRVDAGQKRANVAPGATLADFDAATQASALATPVGINSTTGIAGLTLGGGFGWLTREYGLTIDNLLSAEIVTADGKKRFVDDQHDPDLFWAIRGGGGNYGVVTNFEFRLHPFGPEVFAGLMVFPFAQAKAILQHYRSFMDSASVDTNVWAVMRKAPPLPFLPENVHGKEVVILAIVHTGNDGEKLVQTLRKFGSPVGEHIGSMPYVNWQQAFDPLLTPGARNYWKSHNFTQLTDGLFDTLIEYAGKLPSPHCEIFLGCISGAQNLVAPDAMAYRHRDVKYVINVHSRWETVAEDQKCITWARDFFKASTPFASAGAYVNFMTEEEGERISAVYGQNYSRLIQIKAKYDPENIFHFNQNIAPKA